MSWRDALHLPRAARRASGRRARTRSTDRSRRAGAVRPSSLADRLSGVPFDARVALAARAREPRPRARSPSGCRRSRRSRRRCCSTACPTGMTDETPAVFEPFFGACTEAEIEAGRAQMADAVERVPRAQDRRRPRAAHHPQLRDRLVRARGAGGAGVALDDAQPGALRADRDRAAHGPPVDARSRTTTSRTCRSSCAPACPRSTRSDSTPIRALAVPARRVRVVVVGLDRGEPAARVQARRPPRACGGCRARARSRRRPRARRSRSSSSSRPQPRPRVSGRR